MCEWAVNGLRVTGKRWLIGSVALGQRYEIRVGLRTQYNYFRFAIFCDEEWLTGLADAVEVAAQVPAVVRSTD